MGSRYLTEKDKIETLDEWYEFMADCPPKSSVGRFPEGTQDIEIIEWCEKLNELPFVCTKSSCAGHKNPDDSYRMAHLWIRLTEKAAKAFYKKAFELACQKGINRVYTLYSDWNEELVEIDFEGVDHDMLDESMTIIYNFFSALL